MKLLVASLALLVSGAPSADFAPRDAPQEAIVGRWMGTLEGAPLRLAFNITAAEDGTLSATMDSPDQGVNGIPTESTTFEDGTLIVTVPAVPGGGRFEGTLGDDGRIVGAWSQGPQSIPLVLEKQEEGAPAFGPRPQEPTEPFPYEVEDVSYPNPAAGNELAGTLTRPRGEGPFPAVVLISGSGSQDRDEALMGHRPFFVLADHLTRAGIAVLRFDDRGVGGSTGDPSTATSMDLSSDTEAGVDYLLGRDDIDASAIGLIGHSEGGIIAPMVAARRDEVAFIVLMAGTGVNGAEILYDQAADILAANGVPTDAVQRNTARQERLFRAVTEAEADEVEARFRAELADQLQNADATDLAVMGFSSPDDSTTIETAVRQYTSPWFRYFLSYDPAPMLERVKVPVLAINGTLDLQVPWEVNLSAIGAALERGGNPDYTTMELEGLNHLFQTATTGAPTEYAQIEETIAPVALETMSDWILKRVR